MVKEDVAELAPLVGLSAIISSLCCLPSVIWVLFAGSSAIVAADSLSNELYYSSFRYLLYFISFVLLMGGIILYFRNKGICTINDAKKNKNRIINTTLMVFSLSIVVYLIWNFLVLELLGIAVGLPCVDSAFWNN